MGGRGNPWIPPPTFRMRPPHPGMRSHPPMPGTGPPCVPRFHHSRGPPRGRAMPRGRGRGAPGFRHPAPPFRSNFGAGKRPHPDVQDQNKKLRVTDSGKGGGGEFYCETCDRQLRSSEAFAEHIAQHQTCGLEGCTFTAHPKMVEKHIEAQHLSGLFKRIGNMDSPEDIARWIADRKRNYPSKENIERKKAQKEERMNRGERLFPDTSRYNTEFRRRGGGRGRGRGRGGQEFNQRGRGRGRGRGTFHPRKRDTGFTVTVRDDEELEEPKRLPSFPGTGIFEEKDEECTRNSGRAKEDYSDSEWECSGGLTSVSNSSVPRACDALNSLMAVYGSDSDDAPEEISILHSEESLVNKNLGTTAVKENGNVGCLGRENISVSIEDIPETNDASMAEMSTKDLFSQAESVVNDNLVSGKDSDNLNNKENMESEIEHTEGDEALSDTTLDDIVCREVNFSNNESSVVLESPESTGNMDNFIESVQGCQGSSGIVDCDTSHSQDSILEPVNKMCNSSRDSRLENVRSNVKLMHNGEASQKSQNGPENEKRTRVNYKPYMRIKRKTLLEKLLAKEILHERNVLLQCVRHVVDENFFGLGEQSKQGISSSGSSNNGTNANKNDLVLLQCIQFIVKKNFFEHSGGE